METESARSSNDEKYIVIVCPGMSIYDKETREITKGVESINGYTIQEIDRQKVHAPNCVIVRRHVYAPEHKKFRRIKPDALGKLRICQRCQDYTIRLRRKEGEDVAFPSEKRRDLTRLKSIEPF